MVYRVPEQFFLIFSYGLTYVITYILKAKLDTALFLKNSKAIQGGGHCRERAETIKYMGAA